jgi:hypothetical protein
MVVDCFNDYLCLFYRLVHQVLHDKSLRPIWDYLFLTFMNLHERDIAHACFNSTTLIPIPHSSPRLCCLLYQVHCFWANYKNSRWTRSWAFLLQLSHRTPSHSSSQQLQQPSGLITSKLLQSPSDPLNSFILPFATFKKQLINSKLPFLFFERLLQRHFNSSISITPHFSPQLSTTYNCSTYLLAHLQLLFNNLQLLFNNLQLLFVNLQQPFNNLQLLFINFSTYSLLTAYHLLHSKLGIVLNLVSNKAYKVPHQQR